MRLIALLATLAACGGGSQDCAGHTSEKYQGFCDLGGWLVGADPAERRDFGVAHFSAGQREKFVLQRVTARSKSGVPTWADLATLDVEVPPGAFTLFGGICSTRELSGGEVVAVAIEQPEGAYRVSQAWAAAVEQPEFVPVPASLVECVYDDY